MAGNSNNFTHVFFLLQKADYGKVLKNVARSEGEAEKED